MTYDATAEPGVPGPRLWLSIVFMVVGAIVGITGIALFAGHAVHDLDNITHYDGTAPADDTTPLDSGTWEIYVLDGSSSNPTVLPTDVTVTGPSGSTIPVRAVPSNITETVTTPGSRYVAEVRFDVPQSGDYRVAIDGPPGTKVAIARSITDIVKHSVGWLALFGVGLFVGFTGLVMLIVGIVRRRRARQPVAAWAGGYPPQQQAYPPQAYQQAAVTPAAGWYPDPSIPGTQRYWDGTKWTDQTHNTQ
jgi:hypothetical protein